MDIYAKPGTKVRFLNKNGYDTERERAAKYFNTEQILTVDNIDVHSSVSYAYFKEVPNLPFNTVMFEEVVEEKTLEEKRKAFWDAQEQFAKAMQEGAAQFDNESDEFWNGLTYEQKLNAFHSVCKRIYQGDVKEGRSYRGVLYDIFGFGPDAYLVGMECNYMDIHNYIQEGVDSHKRYNEEIEDKQ